MKRVKYFLVVMVLFLSAMTVHAAEGITISQEKAIVNVGDTAELAVSGTDKTPSWTSYNANIARVDKLGKVTALRKGSTKIRARVGLSSKLCSVTVVDSSIKLNKKTTTIYHGGTSVNTVQLKATVKGASKNVTWESSDLSVAVVDEKGKVTSVSEGTAIITATANSKSASCPVTVKESSISLNMDNLQVSTKGVGSSIKVTPTIVGSKKTVKWVTSDKNIAAVSGGKVTGKKTGTATITATANGVSASCDVVVTQGLISINEERVLLYAGAVKTDTKQLKTNATKTDVLAWASSNESVATVNEKGLVTPVSAGTAVVSVECGGKTDTCIVTVKQTATNILEDSIQLKTKGTDKSYALNKDIVGKTASVKWTTSDKAVATVSGGKVTAKKAGTATITATANGVSDTVTVNVADYDPTIKLNQQEYTLYTVKGNSVTLKATVDGPSKAVTWTSSDISVATVTNKGKVTAVGAGTATISASANGVTAECIVDVTESAVVLDRYSISLDKGQKETIGYDIIGTSQTVKWATTNSKIATVSKGVITAKNYGEADIKVTANGVTSICHVNVTNCKHQYDDGVVTVEPTCGTEGSKTFTCVLCGDSYTEVIPATGKHNFACVTVNDADCVTDGLKAYKCSECGHFEKEDIIPALGHDFTIWAVIKEATFDESGLKMRTCTRCKFEETEIIPVLTHEHDFVVINTVAPTCTEDGYTEYQCSVCGELRQDDVIPAKGHDYVNTIIEPTCYYNGCTEHTCTVCGYMYVSDQTDALGHEAGEWELVYDSCTLQRLEKHCIRCNELIEQQHVAGPGHLYETVVVIEPNCQQKGLERTVCTVCGDVKSENELDGTHIYTDWEITKEPADGVHKTKSDFGTRKCHCTVCGKTVEESIVRIAIEDGQSKEVYGIFLDEDTRTTLDMVNNLRATEKNLKPYQWQERYEDLCYIRAAEISYKYSHDRPGGGARCVEMPDGSAEMLGENIARGQKSAEEVFHDWDLSPGHHANMVNEWCENYCCKGFKLHNTDDDFFVYHVWVQLFGGYRDEDDRYITTEENGENPDDTDKKDETGDNSGTEGDGEDTGNGNGDENEHEETFTIKYAVAGMTDSNVYKSGDIATILDYTGGVPDTMEFIGWGTDYSDKEASYQPGDQIEMTASLRLVPILVNKETGEDGNHEVSGSTGTIIPGENKNDGDAQNGAVDSEDSEPLEITE